MKIYMPESAAKKLGCTVRHLRRLAVLIGKERHGPYRAIPMFTEKEIQAMKKAAKAKS